MRRTEPSLKPSSGSTFSVESAVSSVSVHDPACAVFAPLHYEPGYKYPLVVWLHGQGSDERQLVRVMPWVSMRNYVAIAPRGVRMAAAGRRGRECYGWEQSEESIQQAEQQIFDGIEMVARKFHVGRRRMFLAGFDSGGTMAFRVAMNHPHRFAGVLSLCGAFPRGRTPLRCLTETRRLPIFLATGRDSRQYPATAVCADLRLFHTAGLSTTLRQYPVGHQLTPQMLADMDRWIIEQVTTTRLASAGKSDDRWSSKLD